MPYDIDYSTLPVKFEGGVRRYIENRTPGGDFLNAVLCNDLCKALSHADLESSRLIFELHAWLYNNAPSICWGTKKKFNEWVEPMDEEQQRRLAATLAESWINGNLGYVRRKAPERVPQRMFRDALKLQGFSLLKATLTCEHIYDDGDYQEACDAD
jgi:hypothetical protein